MAIFNSYVKLPEGIIVPIHIAGFEGKVAIFTQTSMAMSQKPGTLDTLK